MNAKIGVVAWITQYSNVADVEDAIKQDDNVALDRSIFVTTGTTDMSNAGWVRVGEGTAEFTFYPRVDIVKNQVDTLRAEQKRVQAEAQARVTTLEETIQSLLAIEDKS